LHCFEKISRRSFLEDAPTGPLVDFTTRLWRHRSVRRTSVVALAFGWTALGLALGNLLYELVRESESYLHAVML
jgi:hypothetical protein